MKKISFTESLILLYIVFMPFSLFKPSVFGVNIKLCEGVFPVLLLSFLIEKRHGLFGKLKNARPLFFFLFFIGAGLASLFNSVSVEKSILELCKYLYLFTLAVIVALSIDNVKSFYRLIRVWLFSSALALSIGLFGFVTFFTDKTGFGAYFVQYSNLDQSFAPFSRIKSTFWTPNMLLTYLHVSAVLAIAYYAFFVKKWSLRSVKALSFLGFIAFIFAGAFFTLSRRFCGMLLSTFLIFKKFSGIRIIRYLKHMILVLFAGFLLLSLLTTVWQIFPVRYKGMKGDKPKISINTKLSLHYLPQLVSSRMFAEHPLLGCGIGNYNLLFTSFYSVEEVLAKYNMDVTERVDAIKNKEYAADPHSMYLGTLAEVGILGFAALIYFFAAFYHYIYAYIRREEKDTANRTIYILTCGLTGFLLNGFTTDILTMRHLWFLIALIVSFISIGKNEKFSTKT